MERIVHAMLTREYIKVLDEPVPMLGDKSPRQLVKTKAGRTKVAEWLKILENGAARAKNDPMATYSRSEEHTSELQSLMRISYAVFCLKKKNKQIKKTQNKL